MHVWCPWRPAEGSGFLGNGVTGCGLPCGYWILKPGPQEEQSALLPAEYLSLTSTGCLFTVFAIFLLLTFKHSFDI